MTFIYLSRLPPCLWCVLRNSHPRKHTHLTTTQLSPPSTSAAAFPANWIRVPQRNYNHGCKQYDFKLLEPIPFSTKDHPGINLGDALRKNCTRLSGKNDQILQATSAVSSCRLLVKFLHNSSVRAAELTQSRVSRLPGQRQFVPGENSALVVVSCADHRMEDSYAELG